MVSSCHMGTKDKSIKKARKRPRKNQINRDNVCIIWGKEHTIHVEIPLLINDYIHWMRGVGLADQLILYYWSKLCCRRTWMPIFLHCLDVLRINAYILYREMTKKEGFQYQKNIVIRNLFLNLLMHSLHEVNLQKIRTLRENQSALEQRRQLKNQFHVGEK